MVGSKGGAVWTNASSCTQKKDGNTQIGSEGGQVETASTPQHNGRGPDSSLGTSRRKDPGHFLSWN